MMADGDKICVMCSESCAGMPRIRNEKGQYAHKACVQAQADHTDLGEDGMDDLLGDIPVEDYDSTFACPGCGMRMDQGAVVCMGCGHNRESGHQLRTKASNVRAGGEAGAGSDMLSSVMNQLVLPILGGCVGGAIGLGIWIGVVSVGQMRLGLAAWGLGVLIGIGVNIGSRHSSGAAYGLIAATIAFGASVGGAYVTATLLADQYSLMLEPDEVSLDLIMGDVVVWEVIDEWMMRGDEVPWPKKWKTGELADWPDDFASVIRDEAEIRWHSKDGDERFEIRDALAAVTPANSQLIAHDLLEMSFLEFMLLPLNVIFTVLAVGTAFVLAARG